MNQAPEPAELLIDPLQPSPWPDVDPTHISLPVQQALHNYFSNITTIYKGIPGYNRHAEEFSPTNFKFYNPDFPEPLREVCNEYILFYLEELLPYLLPLYRSMDEKKESYRGISPSPSILIKLTIGDTIGGILKQRIEGGLFRESQGRIIQICLKAQIIEFRRSMKNGATQWTIDFQAKRFGHLLRWLISSVRSERFETLLLKHLDDDSTDLRVASAVEQASLKHEQHERYLRSIFHQGGKEEWATIWRNAQTTVSSTCKKAGCEICYAGWAKPSSN
ncbi:hypothetical protein BJ508DRAFT_94049 [Ascobolus immersus RN42]|uniref:Uncharacterized protein n=1 Tax=Ascobolus immersus RN42 TaxID=1160509 RepID=A0A3N4IM63_ASCIM|nr:hypothetical protein BJ508DRAFT_94049 [Ascobolus immersus RN42]